LPEVITNLKGDLWDNGSDGRIVSVEVLDACEHVAEPRSIAYQLRDRR